MTMKDSTKNQAQGKLRETKGSIKKSVGKLIDDPKLEIEGSAEKASGKAQQKVGEVQKVFEK